MSLITRRFISTIRDINLKGSGIIAYYLSRLLIPKAKSQVVVDTIYDFKIKVDPVIDNGVERAIYYYGTYEKGTLDVIGKILREGDTFIDVGANIGIMSLYSGIKAGNTGKVISFEPNPKTRQILKDNIQLNNLKNIQIEEFALSSESKKSKIYDRWDINRGGATLIKPDNSDQGYDISEISFTEYINKEKVSIIKIDVEGFELEVLKGAKEYLETSRNPPVLIVEFSFNRNNSFGKGTVLPLYNYIKDLSCNYRLFKAIKGKERISPLVEIKKESDIPQHDNIYCFTYNHLSNIPKSLFKS